MTTSDAIGSETFLPAKREIGHRHRLLTRLVCFMRPLWVLGCRRSASVLSDAELERADRFLTDEDRANFIQRRGVSPVLRLINDWIAAIIADHFRGTGARSPIPVRTPEFLSFIFRPVDLV